MMTSISNRRKIEIFRNERYSPISGWSCEGLLMTDRGRYSTSDGNVSFNTLEEVSSAFMSMGWVWESENWETDTSYTNVDENGFCYATDFIGFDGDNSGSAVKTMIHFVRRKKLVRWQHFDGNVSFYCQLFGLFYFALVILAALICNDPAFTCDNCDLEELDRLEILLRDVIVESSLKRHPRYISQPKLNAIKNDLIAALLLSHPKASLPDLYSTDAVKGLLHEFLQQGGNHWAMASAVFSGSTFEIEAHRTADVVQDFPNFERIEIAKLIIRKYDKSYQHHCSVTNCNNTTNCQCIFARETCPNANCGVVYSKKWDKKHDAICPMKVLDCDRMCGDKVLRKNMASHLEATCSLRPVTCPFAALGCSAVCAFRSLDDHMDEYVQSHLLLALNRVEEQSQVIVSLNKKIQQVEDHMEEFKKAYTATTTGLAASIAAIQLSEQKGFKAVHEEVAKVDTKAQRLNHDLGQELRTEITKIKRQIKIPT